MTTEQKRHLAALIAYALTFGIALAGVLYR